MSRNTEALRPEWTSTSLLSYRSAAGRKPDRAKGRDLESLARKSSTLQVIEKHEAQDLKSPVLESFTDHIFEIGCGSVPSPFYATYDSGML
jgi:hypothetical protein